MPVRSHHTALPVREQPIFLIGDAWATEVVPLLPADLAAQARTPGAFVRVRGLACATDLLRALLAFVLADHSTRSLGAWALLQGLADISEAAGANACAAQMSGSAGCSAPCSRSARPLRRPPAAECA